MIRTVAVRRAAAVLVFRVLVVAILAVGIAGPAGVAVAQSLDLSSAGEGPIEVLADRGIEWEQGRQRFTARGNATATRGDVTVRADELVAYYREGAAGGATEIHRLEARGAVRITSPEETATGDAAFYDVDQGRIELIGNPVRLVTPNETLTARERLTYDVRDRMATAEGAATVRQGERTVQAQKLVAHLSETEGRTTVERVEALGGVTIVTPQETAQGSQGNYDAKTGIATLTGSVKITRDENVLTGSKAIVNLQTGVSTLYGGGAEGRARAVLVPEDVQEERAEPPAGADDER